MNSCYNLHMEICKDLIKLDNTVLGLGFFDGVHLGHQELIKQVVNTAKSNGLKSVIVTFKKSPAEKFVDSVEYLTTNQEKEVLIKNLGVDYLFELDFNDELMKLSAEQYLKDILIKYFSPKFIFTGFNHTFGNGKQGTPKLLAEFAPIYNYEYVQISPVLYKDEPISSTRIKLALRQGDADSAKNLLGRPYTLDGVVQQGHKLGRTLGFPTANISYPDLKAQICFGVYAVEVEFEGQNYRGMLNYGLKPTVEGLDKNPLLEVNIFDFDENIYNKPIQINLLKWIREEKKFDSLDDLRNQIEKDLEECLKL